MNRLARWMMRLYPARWRERYGDELDALITDAGADTRVVADLARGGIRMQFSTWSFPKLAVVLGIVGVVLGVAASFLAKPIYESDALLTMQGTPDQLNNLMEWVGPAVLSRTELSSVINDPRLLLYKDELKVTPLDDVIERMRTNTRIATGQGQTIEISFRYPDAMKAYQTVAILADKVRTVSDQERATRSTEVPHPYLDVIDTANLPISLQLEKELGWTGFFLGVSVPFLWRKIRHKKMLSWWLLLSVPICAILGGISGDILGSLPNAEVIHLPGYRFRSTATMFAANLTKDQIQDVIDGALTHTSLSTIIQDPRLMLYSDELQKTPLEDVVQEMRRRVAIVPVPGHPDYFTISFEYKDRFKAQQTVEALMSRVSDRWGWRRNQGVASIALQSNWGPVSIQDPPFPTATPVGPDRYKFAGVGGIIGMIVGALIGLVRRRWTPESAITQ